MVSKEMKNLVDEFYGKSDRISVLTIELNCGTRLKIIQVYAPTSASTEEDINAFYNDLVDVI